MSKYCERVHDLIVRTVSLVCKSSLPYEKEIKVEGLLGITLDANQVFLIRIDEIFAKLSGSPEASFLNDHEDNSSIENKSQSNFVDIPNGSTITNCVTSVVNVPDSLKFRSNDSSASNNISLSSTEDKSIDSKSETAAFGGSEESVFSLNGLQAENCELKMECSASDSDVMVVQPVGTDEDTDLVSLCSTLDDAVNRIKRKQQLEDDASLVLAPSGILDGYRRSANGNRNSRRKPLKARQYIKADIANTVLSPLEDLSNDFNSTVESVADSSPRNQVEGVDTKSPLSLPSDVATLDASPSLCTDSSQLLANMGISAVGLTTLSAVSQPPSATTLDSTPETGYSLSPISVGNDAFHQLPIEMQNFVTSITRGQTTRSSTRGSHVCTLCGAHFLNADDHLRHMRTHSKSTAKAQGKSSAGAPCSASSAQWKETCPFCDSLFGSTSTRNRHIRVVHERRVKWTCPVCFHKITRSDNIKYHSCVKARRIVVQKKNGEAIQ